MTGILLDTCAAIWLAEGAPLDRRAVEALSGEETVYVSPVSAWEMGLLVSRRRYHLSISVMAWFSNLVDRAALAELSTLILINSSFLPGDAPRDPFDRLVIAAARENGLRLMTRDRRILGYAAQGHVGAIPC